MSRIVNSLPMFTLPAVRICPDGSRTSGDCPPDLPPDIVVPVTQPTPPAGMEWFTYIGEKLCSIDRALGRIADMLQHCCEQGSNVPCTNANATTSVNPISTTNLPQRVLGNNPRRLGFSVNNQSSTTTMYLGISSAITPTGGGALISVPPGVIYYATAAQFPAALTGEWYAVVPSGSVIGTISEQFSN